MNKLIMSLVLCLGLVSGFSFASSESSDSDKASTPIAAEGVTPLEKDSADDKTDEIFWDFITCVHDNHECYDEAVHHGFPHYKAVHDTHVCSGHAHYACYGGHH